MGKTGVQRALLVAFILCMSMDFASTPLFAATLPNCSKVHNGIMKPVEKDVRAAVVKYYAIKRLGPITIYKNREQVIDVKLWSVGWHECLNPGVGNGGYAGAVPKAALSAVQAYVFHKPYPVTPVASNFLMVAKTRAMGWMVVAENTSP